MVTENRKGGGGGFRKDYLGSLPKRGGLLERVPTKFPWSAGWERHSWQSNLHVQRSGGGKL